MKFVESLAKTDTWHGFGFLAIIVTGGNEPLPETVKKPPKGNYLSRGVAILFGPEMEVGFYRQNIVAICLAFNQRR